MSPNISEHFEGRHGEAVAPRASGGLAARGKARAEASARREYEKDRERARREEYDDYGRLKRRMVVSDIEVPTFTLLFCGFLLGFGATFR